MEATVDGGTMILSRREASEVGVRREEAKGREHPDARQRPSGGSGGKREEKEEE